jgi:hypothetical protein
MSGGNQLRFQRVPLGDITTQIPRNSMPFTLWMVRAGWPDEVDVQRGIRTMQRTSLGKFCAASITPGMSFRRRYRHSLKAILAPIVSSRCGSPDDALPRPKPPAGGVKASYPGFIEPALATSIDKVPSGARWIH